MKTCCANPTTRRVGRNQPLGYETVHTTVLILRVEISECTNRSINKPRGVAKPLATLSTKRLRSGTPAEAAARPAAAAAAKAAAESENGREEWVGGDPVKTHHGRQEGRVRRPVKFSFVEQN